MVSKDKERAINRYYFIVISMILFFISLTSLLFDFIFFSYFFEFLAIIIMAYQIHLSTFKETQQRNFWILATLSSIFWIICNLVWYVYHYVFEKDYKDYEFLHAIYIIPTICILSAIILILINKIKNDINDKFSVINDAFGIFFMLCILFIAIFNDEKIMTLNVLKDTTSLVAIISILISFFIIFFTLVSVFTKKTINIHINMIYIFVGCIVFGVINTIYYYYVLVNNQVGNRFITMLYTITFFMFMLASYEFRGNNIKIKSKNINLSTILKWIPVACIIPFVMQNQMGTKISFFVIVVLFGHVLVGYYIKNRNYSDTLLKKEQSIIKDVEKDITKQTNEIMFANLKLKKLVEKDYLTALYSRSFLIKKLEQMLKHQKQNHDIILLHINIRHFKIINSSYGYKIGDKILKHIANKINLICNKKYLCSRISADQFIIIIKSKHQNKELYLNFAKEIINSIQEPIHIDTYKFILTCSIGIGISYGNDKKDVKTLMLNADRAMCFANEKPTLNPFIYTQNIEQTINNYSAIEIKLSQSNINEQFEIFFQPVLDIKNNQIASAEILLRWKGGQSYALSTGEFIAVAEKSDIINKLYEFVINSLANAFKTFKQEGVTFPKISINISPNQSLPTNFIQKLKNIMQEHNINPKYLELEISEKVWTNDERIIDDIFNAIKSIGVGVCLDDFGSEYSSLAYTKKYDINSIKIAKSTIENISNNQNQKLIAKTLIQMSKVMNITSIAKGAEDEKTIQILKDINCDQVQGNIISNAMDINKFIDFLKQNNHRIKN